MLFDTTPSLTSDSSISSDTSIAAGPDSSTFFIDADELHGFSVSRCPHGAPASMAATWMHAPVRITVVKTQEQAAAVRELAGLRHPNVEFLLGIAPAIDHHHHAHPSHDHRDSHFAAVTDATAGTPLRTLLRDAGNAGLPLETALGITLDLARALMYLRAKTTRTAFGRLRIDSVWYDHARQRAVLGILSGGLARKDLSRTHGRTDTCDLLAVLGSMMSAGDLSLLEDDLRDALLLVVRRKQPSDGTFPSLTDVILLLEQSLYRWD